MMTTKTRRKIGAALKAKIALEAVRGQAAVADLAQCYEVDPNQIYVWRKQQLEEAARAFDACARERGRLRARNREAARQGLTDSGARLLSAQVRKMSTPDRRGMLDRAEKALSIRRQCMLLGVARSGVYGPLRPANDNGLALYGASMSCSPPGRSAERDAGGCGASGQSQARAALHAQEGHRSAGIEAEHDEAGAGPQDLSLSVTQHDHRKDQTRSVTKKPVRCRSAGPFQRA
jgi:transposase